MKHTKKIKIVMLLCMITFVGVAMFSVTYAWYTASDSASLNGLELTTGSTGELKIEIAIEGENKRIEMAKVDENKAVIDLGLKELTNIEKGKIGPGAFGEIHFYITSDMNSFTGYTISVTPNYKVVGTKGTEAIKMAKEHIKFYGKKINDGYEKEIAYRDADGEMVGLQGKLDDISEINDEIETEVILYWYWPYEYADVPDKTSISATNAREYDLEDTMIGTYIESIGFTFEFEGNMDEN